MILPNGATREVILTDSFKALALDNAYKWAEFAEMNGRTVRWRGDQYTEALPLCIVTEVVKTNEWALTEVSNASQGAGCSLKLLGPGVEGNVSGSYSWEIHSPSASRVVPPPVSQNFSHSVFIKALRIKFRRRLPFGQPKVKITVCNNVKLDDAGHAFLGFGEFRTGRQSGGGSGPSGSRNSANSGRGADDSLEGAGQWPTDEYEVSVESSTDPAQVCKLTDRFE